MAAPGPPPVAGVDADSERGARILLVDDARHLRDLMKSYLKRTTCRVLTARNGAEALRLCRNERPDLIFLGARLPALDGLAVCRSLKSDPAARAIPVVMVAARDRVEECREAGGDDVLVRPVSQEGFLGAIRRFIALREREEERIPISLRVEFRRFTGAYAAYTRDLSTQGLFLKSRRPFMPGTRLALTIHLERNGPPLMMEGEVRRVVERRPGSHLLGGIGVRFVDVSDEARERLRRFIAERRRAPGSSVP